MGWTMIHGASKADVIEELAGENHRLGAGRKVIARSVRGNHLYAVVECGAEGERPAGHRFLLCAMLGSDSGYGWGYKDMDEGMGPCMYDCPLKFLDMVPLEGAGFYAAGWRDKVRAWHKMQAEGRALKKALKVGDVVKLKSGCNPPQATIVETSPLTGVFDGQRYRLSLKYLEGRLE